MRKLILILTLLLCSLYGFSNLSRTTTADPIKLTQTASYWMIDFDDKQQLYLRNLNTHEKIGASYKFNTVGQLIPMTLEERLKELNSSLKPPQPFSSVPNWGTAVKLTASVDFGGSLIHTFKNSAPNGSEYIFTFQNTRWPYAYMMFTPKCLPLSSVWLLNHFGTAGGSALINVNNGLTYPTFIMLGQGFVDGRFDLYSE